MKKTAGILLMVFCLAGCSELRVIGDAAMRELHAEAMPVNWNKTQPVHVKIAKKDKVVSLAELKASSFSTFRKSPASSSKPVKGLWERGGV